MLFTYLNNFYSSFPEKEDKNNVINLTKNITSKYVMYQKDLTAKRGKMLCKCISGTVGEDVCALFTAFKNRKKKRMNPERRKKKERTQS